VKHGAICYLDEIVEARKDTIVLIHPLTDHRRILPIDKKGEILEAHPDFLLVISYNPGYQSVLKDLKQSTRQRFVSLEFDYPPRDKEAQIDRARERRPHGAALSLATLGEKDPPPEGARPRGGRQHAAPRLRRAAHAVRGGATARVRRRRRPLAHRRRREPARDDGARRRLRLGLHCAACWLTSHVLGDAEGAAAARAAAALGDDVHARLLEAGDRLAAISPLLAQRYYVRAAAAHHAFGPGRLRALAGAG
jgi:MoxR-like ATPase